MNQLPNQFKPEPDDILVKDEKGNFKILRGNELLDFELPPPVPPSPSAPTTTTPIPKSPPLSKAPSLKKEPYYSPQTLESRPEEEKLGVKIPKPVVPSGDKKSAFYFDTEDEEEMKEYRDKVSSFRAPLEEELEKYALEIIQRNNLILTDENLKKRFINLVVSCLKDIRDPLETKEVLKRPEKIGGLNMKEELAEKVMNDLEKVTQEVQAQGMTVRKEIKKEKAEPVKEEPSPLPPPPPPPRQKIVVPRQVESKLQKTRAVPTLQQKTPPSKREEPRIPSMKRPAFHSEKPQVVDIKQPARLLGPIDELKSLKLEDFRRLGGSPSEIVKKIIEKINLLGEESFPQKARGISAWKSSPVNKLYLEIGRESMEKSQSIEEIINLRRSVGKTFLSPEEFTAVADLNKNLRF